MRTAVIHIRLHGGDVMRSFVFRTILSTNLSHLSPVALEAELTSPAPDEEGVRRPVSANAIAHSLQLPYETTRGRVVDLAEAGWCQRTSAGLLVPGSVTALPEHRTAVREIHDAFLDSIRTLGQLDFDFRSLIEQTGLPPLEGRALTGPPSPAFVVHLLMDLQLRHLETLTPMFGDVTRAFVWAGVLQANMRRLLVEREAAWAYAGPETPPPDSLRIPVSVRAVANELGMPYETTRRHVAALQDEGRLAKAGRGVLVPAAALGDEALGKGNQTLMLRFVRLIGELARLDFDFDNPR